MRRRALRASLILQLACTAPQRHAPNAAARPPTAAAPALAPAGAHPGSRPADARELAEVEQLMRETEALRGLRFLSPVRVTVDDARAMRAYVARALKETQLARARRRYLALGALDPALDVRALLSAVMEEELIGYYDPLEKRLAVRSDVARAFEAPHQPERRSSAWRAIVVHELVHALQDQHFALGKAVDQERSTDADNAFGALVEGDATLVMLGYRAKLEGEPIGALIADPERVLRALSRDADELTGALQRAPALLREPLLFRYRAGAYFCAELLRAGGWAHVDRAHADPPRSTRAIRDPKQYLAGNPEPSFPLPPLGWLASHGLVQVDDDVLGALELGALLERGASATGRAARTEDRLLAAWRGDRYVVLEPAERRAIAAPAARGPGPRGDISPGRRAGAAPSRAERHGRSPGTQTALASLWWLRFDGANSARAAVDAFKRLSDPRRFIRRTGAFVLVGRGVDRAVFARAAAETSFRGEGIRTLPAEAAAQLASSDRALFPAPTAPRARATPSLPSRARSVRELLESRANARR